MTIRITILRIALDWPLAWSIVSDMILLEAEGQLSAVWLPKANFPQSAHLLSSKRLKPMSAFGIKLPWRWCPQWEPNRTFKQIKA